MSVTQPPSDTPFGLEPNVAAGLAYLLGIIGGIVMLVGGGTNKFVKWAAAQSITMWCSYIVGSIVLGIVMKVLAVTIVLIPIIGLLWLVWGLLWLALWLWTFITAFQGKEVRVPVIEGLTQSIFKSQLA